MYIRRLYFLFLITCFLFFFFFFFNDTATTEIYTLSLHDALPISHPGRRDRADPDPGAGRVAEPGHGGRGVPVRGGAAAAPQRRVAGGPHLGSGARHSLAAHGREGVRVHAGSPVGRARRRAAPGHVRRDRLRRGPHDRRDPRAGGRVETGHRAPPAVPGTCRAGPRRGVGRRLGHREPRPPGRGVGGPGPLADRGSGAAARGHRGDGPGGGVVRPAGTGSGPGPDGGRRPSARGGPFGHRPHPGRGRRPVPAAHARRGTRGQARAARGPRRGRGPGGRLDRGHLRGVRPAVPGPDGTRNQLTPNRDRPPQRPPLHFPDHGPGRGAAHARRGARTGEGAVRRRRHTRRPGARPRRRAGAEVRLLGRPAHPGAAVRGGAQGGRATRERGPRRPPGGLRRPSPPAPGRRARGAARTGSGGRHAPRPSPPPRQPAYPDRHRVRDRGGVHPPGVPGCGGPRGRDRLVQLHGPEHPRGPPRPEGEGHDLPRHPRPTGPPAPHGDQRDADPVHGAAGPAGVRGGAGTGVPPGHARPHPHAGVPPGRGPGRGRGPVDDGPPGDAGGVRPGHVRRTRPHALHARLLPVRRTGRPARGDLLRVRGQRVPDLQGERLDRAPGVRHGPPGGPGERGVRPRAVHGVRVRAGDRTGGAGPVRDPRHAPAVFGRRPVPRAVHGGGVAVLVLLGWLREMCPVDLPADELGPLLTSLGANVEAVLRPWAGLDEVVFDIEVKPNRPDLMSVAGVAREVAGATGAPFALPDVTLDEPVERADEAATVEIRDPERCPRYLAKVVRGVTVGPAPITVQARLTASGMRPVSNVVDATNYAMLELGQPLHAFDLHVLAGPGIVVRRAEAGERLVTLDDVERVLIDEDLVIADLERSVAIAGVMGSAPVEVHPATRDVLLESASFQRTGVLRTARRLGLRSEASMRFERGVDPEAVPRAADRAAALIAAWSGGTVLAGSVDAGQPHRRPHVSVRPSRASLLLGEPLTPRDVREAFGRLRIEAEERGEDEVVVEVPGYRVDLEREEDLIEDVARVRGYDAIDRKSTR